jgi:hypothetical protein
MLKKREIWKGEKWLLSKTSWLVLWLTPKIPVILWPNSRVFDIVGKIIKVCKFKEVTIGSGSYLVASQPQKNSAPHSMGSRKL